MRFLPLFQSDGRDLCRAHADAHPSASMHHPVQVDLIDPTHGLALGCEAALPCLFDFTIEGTSRAD